MNEQIHYTKGDKVFWKGKEVIVVRVSESGASVLIEYPSRIRSAWMTESWVRPRSLSVLAPKRKKPAASVAAESEASDGS